MNEQRESVDGTAAASASTCQVSERWVGRVLVIATSGVLDMITAPQLEEAIKTAIVKSPRGIVVDMTEVEFLASAGMGILVAAHDEAPAGVDIHIVAEGSATSRPLRLVGIADIVPLHATLDKALAAFSS